MPTVLVVDDSAMDRRLAGGLLDKNQDLNVVYAVDGGDALLQMELHVPDLVVTDLNMPEIDGLELVSILRNEYPMVPVILMTAKGSEEIAVEALRQGAASYVPKKRLATDMLDTVSSVLKASHEDRTQTRLMRRMTGQEASFELENDLDLVSSLVEYLQQGVTGLGLCGQAERVRLGVAIQEALCNAYFHGNLEVSSELREVDHKAYYELARQRSLEEPFRNRRITVSARFSRDEAVYVIRDDGPGFDPASLPDPTDPEYLERPCGRGLLLMRTFMDDVLFNGTGNEVTMVKRKSASSPDGNHQSQEEES